MATLSYDPMAPGDWQDPYPTYRRLRDEAPVHYAPGSKTYTISRYDDVVAALKDPALFSSASAFDVLFQGVLSGIGWRDVVAFARFMAKSRVGWEMLLKGPSESIVGLDPPRHDALRAIVNRAFTPRRIDAWRGRVEELVDGCMARLRRGEPFDVVADLAVPVPMTVIAEMLGVAPERRDAFKAWSDRIIAGVSSKDRKRARPALLDALTELSIYVDEVVAERRRRPQDDLISLLVDPAQGETLGSQGILQFVLTLLVAGNETTTNLIGNAIVALLENPDQLELVAARPELVPNLVEEAVRYDGPVGFIARRATREVEVAGARIPRDARVVVLIGSANRDERQFADPDDFDVTRDTKGHVGFGVGIHFCLGASLARLEARAALAALVPELPRLRAPIGDMPMIDSILVRGRQRILVGPPTA
jgi:cytochrome P450